MALWDVETDGGVAVARYTNPPMNYFCRAAMAELGELIDGWRCKLGSLLYFIYKVK